MLLSRFFKDEDETTDLIALVVTMLGTSIGTPGEKLKLYLLLFYHCTLSKPKFYFRIRIYSPVFLFFQISLHMNNHASLYIEGP